MFFFIVLSRVSSLYILEIKTLSDVLLSNVFSHSVDPLFILLMVSFAVQKFLVWCSLICSFFPFSTLPEEIYLQKILLREMSKFYCLCFLLGFLRFHNLHFKSLICFEFILVYGVSWWSSFIFLHVSVQFSQHRLLKRLFLLHSMLPPLLNINWP